MTIDFRHPDNDELTKMDAEMRAAAADIAKRHRLEVKIEQIWYFPPSPFAKELVESVRRGAEQAGYAHMDIVSGAGHDACYVSRVAPTAMIFVPCKDGISHNEIEDANKADIGAGAQILLQAMVERANCVKSRIWSRPRTAALVATVAGVGGTLPVVLAAAARRRRYAGAGKLVGVGARHRHGAHRALPQRALPHAHHHAPGRPRARR